MLNIDTLMTEWNQLLGAAQTSNQNLLPFVRDWAEHSAVMFDEQYPFEDIPYKAYKGLLPWIQIKAYDIDYKAVKLRPTEGEPDIVLTKALDPASFTKDEVIGLIYILSTYDCSGCCNALSFATLTPTEVVAYGNITHIYHS